LIVIIFSVVLMRTYAQQAPSQSSGSGPETNPPVKQDVSPALRDIAPVLEDPGKPKKEKSLGRPHGHVASSSPDGAVQSSTGPLVGTTSGQNLLGVGTGFVGPAGAYGVSVAPSDSNGAVELNQYVEWVNTAFAVFNKSTGAVTYGPAAGNTLWSGFGGACETNNDGDPVAQYDKIANRWVLSQLSVATTPYYQCVAVSTTSDATGSYYRYAFQMPNFPDYPKMGIWPDGYYISFNMFSGNTFVGARVCAFDRQKMLTGASATQQCFQLGNTIDSLLPSDLDGSTARRPAPPITS
jgi:hypothetical protein